MEISEILKILSSLFSILGSVILAYRVTGILKALTLSANFHEICIKGLADHLTGKRGDTHLPMNSVAHIQRAQKMPLLIFGFLLIILSAILQLVVLIMASGALNA